MVERAGDHLSGAERGENTGRRVEDGVVGIAVPRRGLKDDEVGGTARGEHA